VWGVDLVSALRSSSRTSHYSLILCSDVFYLHPFTSLLQTLYMCSDPYTCVCVVVERRRRDLEEVWRELGGMYRDCTVREVEISSEGYKYGYDGDGHGNEYGYDDGYGHGDDGIRGIKKTRFMIRLYSGKIEGKRFK
ncbi:hypothetical protein EON65_42735, partial [archaeon]